MEAAFSAITQASYRSQVSYAVAAKAMGTARQQGDAAIALLESAAQVQAGAAARSEAHLAAAVRDVGRLIDDNGRLDVTA